MFSSRVVKARSVSDWNWTSCSQRRAEGWRTTTKSLRISARIQISTLDPLYLLPSNGTTLDTDGCQSIQTTTSVMTYDSQIQWRTSENPSSDIVLLVMLIFLFFCILDIHPITTHPPTILFPFIHHPSSTADQGFGSWGQLSLATLYSSSGGIPTHFGWLLFNSGDLCSGYHCQSPFCFHSIIQMHSCSCSLVVICYYH